MAMIIPTSIHPSIHPSIHLVIVFLGLVCCRRTGALVSASAMAATVVIVGGGVAGLATAAALRKFAKVDAVVLEAAPEIRGGPGWDGGSGVSWFYVLPPRFDLAGIRLGCVESSTWCWCWCVLCFVFVPFLQDIRRWACGRTHGER